MCTLTTRQTCIGGNEVVFIVTFNFVERSDAIVVTIYSVLYIYKSSVVTLLNVSSSVRHWPL